MLIQFCGPGHVRRVVGPHTWEPGAGRRPADVDAGLAAVLLTEPGQEFEIDAAEPLLLVAGRDQAGALALAGVGSVAELAGLRGRAVAAAARELGVSSRAMGEMIRRAGALVASGQARADVGEPAPGVRKS